MAKRKAFKYFYRAFFKPDSLDVFDGFDRGFDSSGRGLGYTQAWHRSSADHSPFAVFNEFIAGEIGRFLRLPVPPFAITYMVSGKKREPLFSSLDFTFTRAKLPGVIPDLCVQHLPDLCAGVLAFDILIANEDRHDENLVVDRNAKPREMHIFDHEQSLLGGAQLSGIDRLEALRERLGITGGPVTGGNKHVFLPHITTCQHLYNWADRIRSIPSWFIDTVCLEAIHYGLKDKLAKEVAIFLRFRRDKILWLIDANRSAFSIQDWPEQRHLV